MNPDAAVITLSLIAHTNVGKTTLARTLLRRDVGLILDRPHTTDLSEAFTLLQTDAGARLMLWDTPGFGDTARLLRRLQLAHNPIGWILTQVWDRFADRPLWCSQQAIRNVREEADLVLYLVNAAEPPRAAGYVGMEMKMLSWIGVPVIVLLNQTGPPQPREAEKTEEARWREQLQPFPVVREILSLDAFARCWVQEGQLFDAVHRLLPPPKQAAFAKLAQAWRRQSLEVFEKSMTVLAGQLAEACCDREILERRSLADKLRGLLFPFDAGARGSLSQQETAMALMAERLDRQIRHSLDELIRWHGLEGQAASQILERLRNAYAVTTPLHEGVSALLGGFVSGALAGLVADLAAGGLSFGAGALVGGLLGAAGAGGLAKGYNLIRGQTAPTMRWSADFFEGLVRSALLRYLAVAHYGRGRGAFDEAEHPEFWQAAVVAAVRARHDQLQAIWDQGEAGALAAQLVPRIRSLLRGCALDFLRQFYPAAEFLGMEPEKS